MTFYRYALVLAVTFSSLSVWAQASGEGGAKHEKFIQAFENACGADLNKFCPSAQGRHQIHECLKQNEASLSASCSEFRAKMHHHHESSSAPTPVQ